MIEDIYITGIGISAGGTEALESFFENIKPKALTAYVVIQHLSREQSGFLKEFLPQVTPLPVTQVLKKTRVEKDTIYILPPNAHLYMSNGFITIKKRDVDNVINDAIDQFFISLADQHGEKAIGIIMSGMGADGVKGVQAIKAKGGTVMVQSPDTASFKGMPIESILSDHPDFIAPPGQLATHLMDYISQPVHIVKPKDDGVARPGDEDIQHIIAIVSDYSGVHFRDYKINTIVRRIEKRMKINRLRTIRAYYELLKREPGETKILFQDLLIGVTEFFRDAPAFEYLKDKVIPGICSSFPDHSTVRIWVPGCSTGEEAYSIAMLFEEHIQTTRLHIDYKIFATDVSQKAISIASRGYYREQIEVQVPAGLLAKYFTPVEGAYKINAEVRKKVIFSVHDLLNDPPFIRLDLITCRNLFIYLKEEMQKKLLYTFHYGLNENGYLMLGSNETDNDMAELFERIDVTAKIFKNRPTPKRLRTDYISSLDHRRIISRSFGGRSDSNRPLLSFEPEGFAEMLIEKYAPVCLLLSEKNEVVYTTGNIDKYLKFPNKRTNLSIFDMASEEFSLAIRNGLRKLKEGEKDVVIKNVKVANRSKELMTDLRFSLEYSSEPRQKMTLVEFAGSKKNTNDRSFMEVPSKDAIKEIERLENELHQARRELQYNSDELEAINEELQASNEEMRSSNEEIKTTNEELQASNEELKTVNAELQNKINEITVLHVDVDNLFISTQIATIFLDSKLNIRKFTPAVQKYFNVREGDIGRPIFHYTHNFSDSHLENYMTAVMKTLQPIEKEVRVNGGFSAMKILPYKTDDMRIEGVILTFADITELKESNVRLTQQAVELQKSKVQLEQSEKYFKTLVRNTPDIIMRLNPDRVITFVSGNIRNHLSQDPAKFIGKKISDVGVLNKDEAKQLDLQLRKTVKAKKPLNYYQPIARQKNVNHFFITLVPELTNEEKKLESILLIARDVTDLKISEIKVEEKNQKLQEFNQYMDSFVHAVAHDLRSPLTNLKLILELIEEEDNLEKRESLISKFGKSVARIDDILNGLIEIVDSQVKISEKAKVIAFASVIEDVLDQIGLDMPEDANIELDLKVKTIKHISGYVYSIIRNLVSNSVKYRVLAKPLQLNIDTYNSEKYVVLSVKDNGIGMDASKVKYDLFKPFKRFSTNTDGKGIGLHIIKSMVEKTGGKIEVESALDKGTTFRIYLKNQ